MELLIGIMLSIWIAGIPLLFVIHAFQAGVGAAFGYGSGGTDVWATLAIIFWPITLAMLLLCAPWIWYTGRRDEREWQRKMDARKSAKPQGVE